MNAETREIARRFAACPKWVWLAGMQDDLGTRITGFSEPDEMAEIESRPMSGEWHLDMKGRVPDLDDELTRAGLLPVARRAWNDPTASVRFVDRCPLDSFWEYRGRWVCYGPTEELAVLSALESAT